MKELKEISSVDLMQELRLRGWCADYNMRHVDDVMQRYECTSQQAMSVLEEVLASDRIKEEIYDATSDQAEYMEYHKKYDNDGE